MTSPDGHNFLLTNCYIVFWLSSSLLPHGVGFILEILEVGFVLFLFSPPLPQASNMPSENVDSTLLITKKLYTHLLSI